MKRLHRKRGVNKIAAICHVGKQRSHFIDNRGNIFCLSDTLKRFLEKMKRRTDRKKHKAQDGAGDLKKRDGGKKKFKPKSPKPKSSKKDAMKNAGKEAQKFAKKKISVNDKRKHTENAESEKDQAGKDDYSRSISLFV